MGGQVKNNFKNNPNFKTDSISRDVTAFDVVVVFEVAFDVAFEVGVAVAFEFPFFFCRRICFKMDQKENLSEPQASLFSFPF